MSELKVKLEEMRLTLAGHLEDTTDFEVHRQVFSAAKVVDFSALTSISWMGVQNFLSFLRGLGMRCDFTNIPANVYRLLLLFPEVGEQFSVSSINIPFVRNGQWNMETMQLIDLVRLGEEQGSFVVDENRGELVGALHHLCRPFYHSHLEPPAKFHSPWCESNAEEMVFWYDYARFAEINVESCAFAQHAALLLVIEMLNRIVPQIQNLHRAYTAVLPADDRYDFKKNASIFNDVFTYSEQNFSRIFEKARLFSGVLLEMLRFYRRSDTSMGTFCFIMERLIAVGEELREIAEVVDEVGETIGGQVHALAYVFDWLEGFRKIKEEDLDPKALNLIRRRLNISGDGPATWASTLQEIEEQFRKLREEFDRCVLSVQQFDLIKQVFDHRIRELNILQEHMVVIRKNKDWYSARRAVQDAAAEKLVTDLEKLSFEFFFPEGNNQKQQLAAGEMTLF